MAGDGRCRNTDAAFLSFRRRVQRGEEQGFLLERTCAGAQGCVAPALDGRPLAARRIQLSVLFPNGKAAGNSHPLADPAQWAHRAQCGILWIN